MDNVYGTKPRKDPQEADHQEQKAGRTVCATDEPMAKSDHLKSHRHKGKSHLEIRR
jgi:hypothetical protein